MARLLLQIAAAACLVGFPWSCPLDHQVISVSDADSLLQAVVSPEQSRPKPTDQDEKKEARKLGAKKTKVSKTKVSKVSSKEAKRKAKQRASKLVRKNVMLLLKKAGIPDVLAGMFSGFIHDSLMDLRGTSRGRQEFIDYMAEELGNMTQDGLNLTSLLLAVREAGEHSHLEKPMKEFINDVEELLMPENSTDPGPTPAEMFQVVARGFESMGMPAEMSSFLREIATAFETDSLEDPTKMFGMMSGLYRKLGMPDEVIGVLDEFSSLFTGIMADASSGGEVHPEKVMGVIATMMKKLGMPPAMLEFCSDLGKFMANNTAPTPEMMIAFMGKAMQAMGAPPEMASGMGELVKAISGDALQSPDAFNLTKVISDIQGVDMGKMLTGMAKVGQAGFTKLQASPASLALVTNALARIATEFRDMVDDDEPLTWEALTGEVLAPSLLHMVLSQGRQLVQAKLKQEH